MYHPILFIQILFLVEILPINTPSDLRIETKCNVNVNMNLFEFIEKVKNSRNWKGNDYNWPMNNFQHFTSQLINILKATRKSPNKEDWIDLPKIILNSLKSNEKSLKN